MPINESMQTWFDISKVIERMVQTLVKCKDYLEICHPTSESRALVERIRGVLIMGGIADE